MRRQSSSFSARFIGEDPELQKNDENEKGNTTKKRSGFIKNYLVDYTANSNLHGLKYIGESERMFFEKVFWLLMFTCCLVLCAGLIQKVWIKWNESPVIVSFAETSTPVWQIPYPAITVCIETKAMQRRFNFTNYFYLYHNATANITEEERHLFQDISLVCDSHLAPKDGRLISDGVQTVDNIVSLAPNISEVFFGCKWKDIPKNSCEDLFSPILTEEGQCYTFNMLSADELFRTENLHEEYQYLESRNFTSNWSLEDGYKEGSPIETYPHRGTGYGAKAGLTLALKAHETDLDYLCKGPVQGFKILLHNPAELPRLSQQYFRTPFSQEVVVAVKPKMMTTSEGLRPYPPSSRKCFFPNERYLRYFRIYTQSNCEMECLSNFTYVRCGCVQFGMPRGRDIPVCNSGNVICVGSAQMELVTIDVLRGLNTVSSSNLTNNMGEAEQVAGRCQCLPSCTSIEYEAETSQADYDFRAVFQVHKWAIDDEYVDALIARVLIYFKEAQFITSRRSELYGQTDFLANCGGLLGLFMGFSILSVVEIIYFLTLRIFCMLWQRHQVRKGTSNKQKVDNIKRC